MPNLNQSAPSGETRWNRGHSKIVLVSTREIVSSLGRFFVYLQIY